MQSNRTVKINIYMYSYLLKKKKVGGNTLLLRDFEAYYKGTVIQNTADC